MNAQSQPVGSEYAAAVRMLATVPPRFRVNLTRTETIARVAGHPLTRHVRWVAEIRGTMLVVKREGLSPLPPVLLAVAAFEAHAADLARPRPTSSLDVETIRVAGCLIRPTFRKPGGRVHGYLVTRGRRVVAHVHAVADVHGHKLSYSGDDARRSAIRFAKGKPNARDEMNVSADGLPARPRWLAFAGRVPVVAEYVECRHRLEFHPSTGIPPRGGRGWPLEL